MSDQERNEDIYSCWNKSTFLHFQDALEIGKIVLFSGTLSSGKRGSRKMENSSTFYANPWDLIPYLNDLLVRGKFLNEETLFRGTVKGDQVISRTLRMAHWDEGKMPVIFEIGEGPGKKNGMGGIEPAGDANKVKVMMSVPDARRMAAKVLAFINAWIALGMPQHSEGGHKSSDITDYAGPISDEPHELDEPEETNDDDGEESPIDKARAAVVVMGESTSPPLEETRRKFFAILNDYAKKIGRDPDEVRGGLIMRMTAGAHSSWTELTVNEGKALTQALYYINRDA